MRQFRTGICLHGHTLYSEECLWFLPRYLSQVPGGSRIANGVDFSRAFFRPPLTPASAFQLERKQVAGLDLRPLVSLTDHDSIEAGASSSRARRFRWNGPCRTRARFFIWGFTICRGPRLDPGCPPWPPIRQRQRKGFCPKF